MELFAYLPDDLVRNLPRHVLERFVKSVELESEEEKKRKLEADMRRLSSELHRDGMKWQREVNGDD